MVQIMLLQLLDRKIVKRLRESFTKSLGKADKSTKYLLILNQFAPLLTLEDNKIYIHFPLNDQNQV